MKLGTILKGNLLRLSLGFCLFTTGASAQQSLLFGTVKMNNKISQARFEIDSLNNTMLYAPYGIKPIALKDVKNRDGQLTFSLQHTNCNYACILIKAETSEYKGSCTCENGPTIEIVMRQFSREDGILQGENLPASLTDIQIIDRALILLNSGKNWNRLDNRVCDESNYTYKWSLFCALHQASIDVDGEYRHLRHAMQATRQAINEATNGKQYAHTLRDFNNEAESFEVIAKVLNRGKEIINRKIERKNK